MSVPGQGSRCCPGLAGRLCNEEVVQVMGDFEMCSCPSGRVDPARASWWEQHPLTG